MSDATPSQMIQLWIERLRVGDESAREQLLACACQRMTELAHRMLKGFRRVRRWEETGDVVQNAMLRLHRTLADVHPATSADFFRLASLNIRRELLDLSKHYYGAHGHGAHHHSVGVREGTNDLPPVTEPDELDDNPERLALWTEFHRQVELLPDEEREVFDLLWYQELPQADAASVLGVAERTVKRRWRAARLRIHEALGGEMPD
jgi:RNA polymerase sigma-70 factor (ECF subfamily)